MCEFLQSVKCLGVSHFTMSLEELSLKEVCLQSAWRLKEHLHIKYSCFCLWQMCKHLEFGHFEFPHRFGSIAFKCQREQSFISIIDTGAILNGWFIMIYLIDCMPITTLCSTLASSIQCFLVKTTMFGWVFRLNIFHCISTKVNRLIKSNIN